VLIGVLSILLMAGGLVIMKRSWRTPTPGG